MGGEDGFRGERRREPPEEQDDSILSEIVERLIHEFQPERVYLFGSRARGDVGPDSDYDLLVLIPESGDPPYRRAVRAEQSLWGIWEAADVLVWTRDEFERRRHLPASLAATVLREGKLLYAA